MGRNEQIVAFRGEGVGPREIARRMGLTYGAVISVLYRAGLTESSSGRRPRVHRHPSELRLKAMAIATRTSCGVASRLTGVHRNTISAWLRERA